MTPLLTRPRPAPPRSRAALIMAGIAAATALILLLGVLPSLGTPAVVDTVTISNPHEWSAEIDIEGPERVSWLRLGAVGRESTQRFQEVLDPGDQWVIRFTGGGTNRTELVLTRRELEQANWNVAVPGSFADTMRSAGEAPTSRQ